MGLFANISKVLRKAENEEAVCAKELAALSKDGRLHSRYALDARLSATLTLETGASGVIKNISYGGLAVRFETPPHQPQVVAAKTRATITLLGQSISCEIKAVRLNQLSPQVLFAGFSMQHSSPDTLLFLREFIEPLRWGESLAEVPQDVLNERYKAKEWSCFRGEGPTDLLVRRGVDSTKLEEVLLTFRNQQAYGEVGFRNGQLKTGRTLAAGLMPGAQVAISHDLDMGILRQAAYILLGAPPACRDQVEAALKLILDALDDTAPQR